MSKALLFINGKPPKKLPATTNYDVIVATDGAYNYLQNTNLKLDIVLGDLDSILTETDDIKAKEIVEIYDQNYTDFQKALKYLIDNKFTEVDVYGSAGEEQDHFLGNLSTALEFKEQIKITFYEDEYYFYLLNKKESIKTTSGKIVSLFPFPIARKIYTNGLKYPLQNEDLEMGKRIGIRNEATQSEIEISFAEGEMFVFLYY